uniref:IBB domain-containing protein n=1 Tax=Amphimedon queenslandica TaxID=400682 RepID=A0A1X7SH49_AMPQE
MAANLLCGLDIRYLKAMNILSTHILYYYTLLPILTQLINHQDKEVVSDACWALSYVTDGSTERIQTVVNSGVVPRLVELTGCGETSLASPSLRAIGNVVTGNDEQTQHVLNCGALQHFDPF